MKLGTGSSCFPQIIMQNEFFLFVDATKISPWTNYTAQTINIIIIIMWYVYTHASAVASTFEHISHSDAEAPSKPNSSPHNRHWLVPLPSTWLFMLSNLSTKCLHPHNLHDMKWLSLHSQMSLLITVLLLWHNFRVNNHSLNKKNSQIVPHARWYSTEVSL